MSPICLFIIIPVAASLGYAICTILTIGKRDDDE
jgi:hypothetical protein